MLISRKPSTLHGNKVGVSLDLPQPALGEGDKADSLGECFQRDADDGGGDAVAAGVGGREELGPVDKQTVQAAD